MISLQAFQCFHISIILPMTYTHSYTYHHHYIVLAINGNDTMRLKKRTQQLTSNNCLQSHRYYYSQQPHPVLGSLNPHYALIMYISKILSIIYKNFYLLFVLACSHHLNSVGIPCSFHHWQMQSRSIGT